MKNTSFSLTPPTLMAIIAIVVALSPQTLQAKTIDLRGKRLPGIKLSYANTLQLEQTARQHGNPKMDTQSIEVKFKCVKKWPIRGRSDTKAYQCDPIEMEVPE